MATHSGILAWKILRTEEPAGLQSMGSQRVGHDKAANTYLTLTLRSKHTHSPGRVDRPPFQVPAYPALSPLGLLRPLTSAVSADRPS